MKRIACIAFCLALALSLAAQDKGAPSPEAEPSYALGMLLGANIKGMGLDISLEDFFAGFKAVVDGKPTKLTDAQAQVSLRSALQAAQEKKLAKNLAEGKAFLEGNRAKKGVKVTASGLQYEVLAPGSGAKPAATDTVTVNYEGRRLDGKVFDSSYQRNEPATFPLDGVIKGWTEGLQLMSVGSKYRFAIPSELAYGEGGAGDDIEPNSVLVFEVELLSIGEAKN